MELLREEIVNHGIILNGNMLKVDGFLNHQINPRLINEIGREFAAAFRDLGITKVLTIESGGIAPAYAAALELGVPVIFCKKTRPATMRKPLYATVHSYTKNTDSIVCMESDLLTPDDRVLFIDDFLANGQAFLGVCSIVSQADATLAGAGFCIEKSFQNGRKAVEETGVPVLSLARIGAIENGRIDFLPDEDSQFSAQN